MEPTSSSAPIQYLEGKVKVPKNPDDQLIDFLFLVVVRTILDIIDFDVEVDSFSKPLVGLIESGSKRHSAT